MRKILLDTNGYVAFKRGDEQALQIIRQAESIGLSTVVLGELLAGFAAGGRQAKNRQELREFLDSPRVKVLDVNEETADFYAHTYYALRRKGKPLPTNDLWIASTALQNGYAIFTYDRHFFEVDGLIVGRQASDFLP